LNGAGLGGSRLEEGPGQKYNYRIVESANEMPYAPVFRVSYSRCMASYTPPRRCRCARSARL
jgi:hypothetical protein